MRAIVVRQPGATSQLVYEEVADPVPAPGEALIRVVATSVNRADLLQRAGHYPPPPGASPFLGLDIAGFVERSAGCKGVAPGDAVCAVVAGGGYAERAVVDERLLMPIPRGWSVEEAAAMPEVFVTAYLNLFIEGGLVSGERVLIHAGASGVGTAAIQLAKQAGAQILVTVSSQEKAVHCRKLGAHVAVNYKEQDFVKSVIETTEGRGVDLILDCVGGAYLSRNLQVLAPCGRMIVISLMGGSSSSIDLRSLLAKRLTVKGSVLRTRSLDEKIELKKKFMNEVWPHFEQGAIRPVIDSQYRIEDAEQAHQRLLSNATVGKILLRL